MGDMRGMDNKRTVGIPFSGGLQLLFMVVLLSVFSRWYCIFVREDEESNEGMPLVPQVSQGQAVPTDERHILEQDRRKKSEVSEYKINAKK